MKGLAITVADDGFTYAVTEFDGDLEQLQAVVGGYIEPAPTSENVTLWVNEEGKYLGLPVNRLAMDVWLRWDVYRCVLGGDYLAGNVVVTGGVDRHGNTLDLGAAERRWVHRVAADRGLSQPRPDWERFGLVDKDEVES